MSVWNGRMMMELVKLVATVDGKYRGFLESIVEEIDEAQEDLRIGAYRLSSSKTKSLVSNLSSRRGWLAGYHDGTSWKATQTRLILGRLQTSLATEKGQ